MYNIDNEKIGKYLGALIDVKFQSRRNFGRKYLEMRGEECSEEALQNMSNRLSQIVKGKKSIQTYDLLHFSELLDVSCEQILTAGKYSVKRGSRLTNYDIAFSNGTREWEKYIGIQEKPFLTPDEYGKNVFDYAIEFGNYDLLKFLSEKGYWIDRMNYLYITTAWAIKRGDIDMLRRLNARQNVSSDHAKSLDKYTEKLENELSKEIIEQIALSDSKEIMDYFTDEFETTDDPDNRKIYVFDYLGQTIDLMLKKKNPHTEFALKRLKRHNENFIIAWQSMLEQSRKLYEKYSIKDEHCFSDAENYVIEDCDDTYGSDSIDLSHYFDYSVKCKNRSLGMNMITVNGKSDNKSIQALINRVNDSYHIIEADPSDS